MHHAIDNFAGEVFRWVPAPDQGARYLSVDEGNVDPVVIQQVSGYRTNPVDFIDHG